LRSLFNNLTTKVLGLAVLAVSGMQLTTVLPVLNSAETIISRLADEELVKAENIIDNSLLHRADALRDQMRPLVQSSALHQAIRSGDKNALRSSLQGKIDLTGADIALLLAADGTILVANSNEPLAASGFAELTIKPNELFLTETAAYEMLTLPIEAPNTIGWFSLGYQIDDRLANSLARAAGVEITMVRTIKSGQTSVLGSSLATAERDLLNDAAQKIKSGTSFKTATREVGEYFRSKGIDYLPDNNNLIVLVHKRVAETRQLYVALRSSLLHAASTSMLFALLLGYFLWCAVTNPVRKLVSAARRISVGNYTEALNINSKNEFGELASSFEQMRIGIAEREQRIVYQAEFDDLTGLPNRRQGTELLRGVLRGAAKTDDPVVVMVMHLQRFREIQSSLGHKIGEELLRQIAERMRVELDKTYVLARLEGDQFLVVAPEADEEEGKRLARRLTSMIDTGLNVQSVNVTMDACIGFCVWPEHGHQPEELLRRAAVAKNDAHESQQRIWVYQNGREARHVRQLAILGDLRRATRENELQLYLQPKVDLQTAKVCGAEALLRWSHPELGQISPLEFIPLAERAGCIGMITQWVLSRAIAQCRSWHDQGFDLPIAVNISAQDLLHDNFIPIIEHELDVNGMDASCMICEITEEAVMHDVGHAQKVLERLRGMGARTSMDDFGIGYSSLSNLQKLPMDELKIDRAFVMHLPDNSQNAAIARTIIDLAHNLNLEVVAEGVETVAALRWLREAGCERAQGYYLSKPMPAFEFAPWVRNWEHTTHDVFNGTVKVTDSQILGPQLIS
jgi:diguanylate cyclase (GGDEF)-like protein